MPSRIASLLVALSLFANVQPADAQPSCHPRVFEDRNGNGRPDRGEPGLPGIRISDGVAVAATDRHGLADLAPVPGRTLFVIKPAGFRVPRRDDGLPLFWQHVPDPTAPALKFGGLRGTIDGCPVFALQRERASKAPLDVLLFADPQPKSLVDVGYLDRDIVQPIAARGARAQLGLSLGDIVDDDLSLYGPVTRSIARLGVPWLHVPGNHDLDFDASRDEASVDSYRRQFGPDTFAWEEKEAVFLLLDDVVYRPGQRPAYIGGLREDQFRFLEAYLPTLDARRLLVVALHVPLFTEGGRETFRTADRARLFGLLARFPHVLVLSGHSHTQRHVFHGAASGWAGRQPLHEYNVGAASGAFWSGVKDPAGIPDTTMADGTPNGHARLRVLADGSYRLSWHPARLRPTGSSTAAMALHAPRVLRQGAYPAWGVYANVYMGFDGLRVEYRVDGADWKPMIRVERADPRLLAENVRDDEAGGLRGYDRSPEAVPSTHLWRGALPTDLTPGEHQVDVRAFDPWIGEQTASITYRLQSADP